MCHNNGRCKVSPFFKFFYYFYRINWILEGKWWCCSSGLNRLVLRGQAWGHVLVASSTVFLSACRFRCLLIFRIIILCHCKGVVLANRWLDKFFYFSWIVIHKDWSSTKCTLLWRLFGWDLRSCRNVHRCHMLWDLVRCPPMVSPVVSPPQWWIHFLVHVESGCLHIPQSDLHENPHEVAQFMDCLGAQVWN